MSTIEQGVKPERNSYLNSGERLLACMLGKLKEVPEPNYSHLVAYYQSLRRAAKDDRTIARQLRELRFLMRALDGKDAKEATEGDIDRIVLAVTESRMAAISKRKHLLTLRVFFGFLYGNPIDSHEYPPIVKNVKFTIRNLRKEISKSEKTAADIPTLDEIKRMVEVADSQIEKTVVMLLASTGMRVGELLGTKMSSLQLSKDPQALSHIVLRGKTGTRTVPLMRDMVPFITAYVEAERKDAGAGESLFVYNGHALDFSNVRAMLAKLAEKAKVKHRIHSHIFRYYLSSYFAQNGKQESQMSAFFGYSNDIARHYTKLASADSILEDEHQRPNRKSVQEIECGKCGALNAFDSKLCTNCMNDLVPEKDEAGRLRQEFEEFKASVIMMLGEFDQEAKEKAAAKLRAKLEEGAKFSR